ncbi:MAG: HAD family hydrolase [Hyphomicrobiaceae bacterium]
MVEDLSISAVEGAVEAVLSHDGPVIVDFDETLYLRNSTEDFIDAAAPGLLGRLVCAVVGVARPWALLGGQKTRDVWRVRIASLFPGAMRRWQRRAAELADTEVNREVAAVLQQRPDAIVATLGFDRVVRPLLENMGFGSQRLIACRMGSLRDRQAGKLALVRAALGQEAVSRSAVLTDSMDDADLLDASARPALVKWSEARFVPAHSGVYLPLEYTHRVKRPGLNFVQRSILGDDYMLWLVASIVIAAAPFPHVVGMLLLSLSFWTIYELGYVDNDRVGERFEAAPTLTAEYHDVPVATSVVQAWIWAVLLGVAGVAVVEQSFAPSFSSLLAWKAVLIATFGVYLLYNRVDKSTRIWLYALLQLARAAAFLVVVPVTAFGAMAIAAHALSRWFVYFIYRTIKRGWPMEISANIIRLVVFGLAAAPLAATVETDKAGLLTAGLIVVWFAFRSGPRLADIIFNAKFITSKPEL